MKAVVSLAEAKGIVGRLQQAVALSPVEHRHHVAAMFSKRLTDMSFICATLEYSDILRRFCGCLLITPNTLGYIALWVLEGTGVELVNVLAQILKVGWKSKTLPLNVGRRLCIKT